MVGGVYIRPWGIIRGVNALRGTSRNHTGSDLTPHGVINTPNDIILTPNSIINTPHGYILTPHGIINTPQGDRL